MMDAIYPPLPPPPDDRPVIICGAEVAGSPSSPVPAPAANLNPVADCDHRGTSIRIYADDDPQAASAYFYSYAFQPVLPAVVDWDYDRNGTSVRIDFKMKLHPSELKRACANRPGVVAARVEGARPLPLLYSRVRIIAPRPSINACELREPGMLHTFNESESVWVRLLTPTDAQGFAGAFGRADSAIAASRPTVRVDFGIAGTRTRNACRIEQRSLQSVNYGMALFHTRQGKLPPLRADAPDFYSAAAVVLTDDGMARLSAEVQSSMATTVLTQDGQPCNGDVLGGAVHELLTRDVQHLASPDRLEDMLDHLWTYAPADRDCAVRFRQHLETLKEDRAYANVSVGLSPRKLIAKLLGLEVQASAGYETHRMSTGRTDLDGCIARGFRLNVAKTTDIRVQDQRVWTQVGAWTTVEPYAETRSPVSAEATPNFLGMRVISVTAPGASAGCAVGDGACPSLQMVAEWDHNPQAPGVATSGWLVAARTASEVRYSAEWALAPGGFPIRLLTWHGVVVIGKLGDARAPETFRCVIRPSAQDVEDRAAARTEEPLVQLCPNSWKIQYRLQPAAM